MIHWHPTLPSTQDEAHRLAASGAPHGTAVAARVQTAGRGTRGKPWVSGAGGLWLSVVCRPEPAAPIGLEVLSVRVGLAIAEYLDRLLPRPGSVALKWPNDLMLGAGKVGGILTEAKWQGERLSWIVVGVGLNLHNPLPRGAEPPAARLADVGVTAGPEDLADPITGIVAATAKSGTPLSEVELAAFKARNWLSRGHQG